MTTRININTVLYKIACVVFFTLFIFALPYISNAQTEGNQPSLLESIRILFDESFNELSAEVQSLRNEVRTLRAEVRQSQSGGGTVTIPSPSPVVPQSNRLTTTLRPGDTGNEVRKLQEALISLGFNIPAGVTGNFLSQTEQVLIQLQQENGLSATGILDQGTLNLLNRLLYFEPVYIPPRVNEPEEPREPEQPVITPGLTLIAPQDGLSFNAGQRVAIIWRTTYAPAGARISFRLTNQISSIIRPVHETEELSGTYEWIVPSNMPGNNEFSAELLFEGEFDRSPRVLASRLAVISIFGGSTETTTVNTPNTSGTESDTNYDNYVNFYKGAGFASCMADYPETVALISGWLDDGLLRHQFPWGNIVGAAANKVAECEGDEFDDLPYVDCVSFATESACSLEASCTWFGTFCGDEGYDPLTGGGSCVGTTEETCTSVANCHWYTGSAETEMSRCFYPNATINGNAPGYTVWCEYDYQNCHEGDPSGAQVSLEGLALGAPSSCETGFGSSGSSDSSYCYYDASGNSGASVSSNSFFANVLTAFSRALQSFQKIFGL